MKLRRMLKKMVRKAKRRHMERLRAAKEYTEAQNQPPEGRVSEAKRGSD